MKTGGGGVERVGRRQQHLYRTEPAQFPPDFAARLTEFRDAAGLSWRELARLLRVNVRSVHRWRRGATPDAGHLLSLLELATECGLLHTLAPRLAAGPAASSERRSTQTRDCNPVHRWDVAQTTDQAPYRDMTFSDAPPPSGGRTVEPISQPTSFRRDAREPRTVGTEPTCSSPAASRPDADRDPRHRPPEAQGRRWLASGGSRRSSGDSCD
ncbi:MAG: helix-turn-helix transcriptional regulator [Chloroflexi bacterium]|nr:helix-turn-helix transcriptional regulator [Chloroflexota bacterium]MYC01772.1 helix-turn-helix transcriptional regulator [Chloroflexota bacterium]